jgi:predicted dienelactone hydrolase
MNALAHRWIVLAAIAVLILGVILSRVIEPGVRVEKVTLAQDTPALRFMPSGAGPHPVALLAHGYAASKETLFRYGEALAAAGFI